MGRPRSFSEQDVLDCAMRAFWAHGYAGTSIQDLVDATGVNRASLYATFGDKDRLFLASLDHYVAEVSSHRLARLKAAESAREGIWKFFDDIISFGTQEGRGLGCLLTNSLVELAPHDPQVAAKLEQTVGRVRDALEAAVRRGQAAGEFRADGDPKALASFLLTVNQGLRVLMRADAKEAELRGIVKTSLAALG